MGNSPGTIFLIGAAASAWLIYDMATATEAPSQTLGVMKYLLIAIMVGATLYSGAKWFANPAPPKPPRAPGLRAGSSAQDRAMKGRATPTPRRWR